MDLGDLEMRIDRCVDRDDGRVTAQEIDERTEIGKHRR
jgi:hypothetical protein